MVIETAVSLLRLDGGRSPVKWQAGLALVGRVLTYLSATLLFPIFVGLLYGESVVPFLVAGGVALLTGVGLRRLDHDPDIGPREGFLMVAATWLAVALVGAVPYVVAGAGTESTLAHPVNALFESMSGFTTTGATVMGEISFQRHSRGLLIWRQLTQWLGGMGIVVLAVAILPELSVGGAQLMDAEAPGPSFEKLTPRIAETARVLWLAYLGFTVLEIILLYGLHLAGMAPNMTLYNAVAHGLTTMPTGGFSPEADSIAAFSAVVQWLIVPFMVVAGTNFALFWGLLRGNPRTLLEDTEFRAYTGVLATATAIIAVVLYTGGAPVLELGGQTAGVAENSLRQAAFQAAALVTTTGYATSNFAQWGTAGQYLVFFLMFVGGSGGSTGGAVKIIRWVVIAKAIRRELFTTVHPAAVQPLRIGDTILDETGVRAIFGFVAIYLLLFFFGTALVTLDAAQAGVDITVIEAMSGVASCVGNVGPALGDLGPFGSYLALPPTTKLFLAFLMWVGRLEIIPVLVLFTGTYWRS